MIIVGHASQLRAFKDHVEPTGTQRAASTHTPVATMRGGVCRWLAFQFESAQRADVSNAGDPRGLALGLEAATLTSAVPPDDHPIHRPTFLGKDTSSLPSLCLLCCTWMGALVREASRGITCVSLSRLYLFFLSFNSCVCPQFKRSNPCNLFLIIFIARALAVEMKSRKDDMLANPKKVVLVKAVKPPAALTTELSTFDKTALAIATCRALFYPLSPSFNRFDDDIMARAIERLASDCPMFAGRVRKISPLLKWSISSLTIDNSNAGIEFAVVQRASSTIGDMMDPSAWTMKSIRINTPRFPAYLPEFDSGVKFLKGKEPMCKVQLTHFADGDVLAVSMSHVLTDGMHWPQFMTHLAARYKELATHGAWVAPAEKLMAFDGNKGQVNYGALREMYLADGLVDETWKPSPIEVKSTLMDHVRACMLLLRNGLQKVDFNIIGVPNGRLKGLKAEVMECVHRGIKEGAIKESAYVSKGDVVQALAMMMVKGAEKQPVLPVAPKSNIVLAQVPRVPTAGPDKYFGNSVDLIKVNFVKDEMEVNEEEMAPVDILTRLAVRIRERTLEYRQSPEEALQGVYDTEEISKHRITKSLAFLAGRRFPLVNCTTNYIGTLKEDSELSFGTKGSLLNWACQWLVAPLARDMVVVRPHEREDALLFMMALTPKDSKRLRASAWIRELVPDATFY